MDLPSSPDKIVRHYTACSGHCILGEAAKVLIGRWEEAGPEAVGPVPERAPPYRYAPVATLK